VTKEVEYQFLYLAVQVSAMALGQNSVKPVRLTAIISSFWRSERTDLSREQRREMEVRDGAGNADPCADGSDWKPPLNPASIYCAVWTEEAGPDELEMNANAYLYRRHCGQVIGGLSINFKAHLAVGRGSCYAAYIAA